MHQLIEYQYFGPVNAFVATSNCSNIVLEQYEHWQKMSFRNRCQILGAAGVQNLSVPLVGARNQRVPISRLKIDYSQPWQRQHWRSLETAYNRSPFFQHYAEGVRLVVFGGHHTLMALNEASLSWALGVLKWPHRVERTAEYVATAPATWLDCRGTFLPANRKAQSANPYQQVFGAQFEPNLSILDLVFNLGPQSSSYLKKQAAS
jgi:hypothetical protein